MLKCFLEIKVNCGRTLLTKILKGSKDQYIFEGGLYHNTWYGSLSKFTQDEIKKKIDNLIEKGFFEQVKSDSWYRRPILQLTDLGYDQIKNIPLKEVNDIHREHEHIDTHESVEKKVEDLIRKASREAKQYHNANKDNFYNDTTNKANKDEVFISRENWSKLHRAHMHRDKKRRRDFERDGGTF
ncbi:MAG: RQC domain-containing protein [Candidatus Thermoplasmatota archaeon]|nr:RQC domain-containing protein [Candidatus Thermoplasmatota archaeon]